jgi:hypothetical protein
MAAKLVQMEQRASRSRQTQESGVWDRMPNSDFRMNDEVAHSKEELLRMRRGFAKTVAITIRKVLFSD